MKSYGILRELSRAGVIETRLRLNEQVATLLVISIFNLVAEVFLVWFP